MKPGQLVDTIMGNFSGNILRDLEDRILNQSPLYITNLAQLIKNQL